MKTDQELAKMIQRCDSDSAYFATQSPAVQLELKQYCKEIIKYGGIVHAMPGGRFFTDNTLLRPAKNLIKSLRKRKEEE